MQISTGNANVANSIQKLNELTMQISDKAMKFNSKMLKTAATDAVQTQAVINKTQQVNELA